MITKEFQFANGDKAKDKVTGFSGTIVGTAYYLTGCNQYLITPECKDKKSHKKPQGHWFDEDRMVLIEEEVVKSSEVTKKDKPTGADIPAPGGSRDY